jgi:hypothetical protein
MGVTLHAGPPQQPARPLPLGLDLLRIEQLGEPVGLAAQAPTQRKGKE